ncbi:hypothetical protein GYMLUDRAFT_251853 [Collybiopsis luxurians FD-317 M1]|uniref:F-box domain-containing protein n=1 Tax=Collybiopsis luxurians FD-317 M1 TaxID=944289 RepID=A0A0D0BBH0_9AGAR|nr:hypothetical protein GYMLUDRAFT_251853 [Collybiopsis luxurians FD-317 M1]
MPSFNHLSNEFHNLIAGHLSDDSAALAALSSVDQSLCTFSNHHLYKEVKRLGGNVLSSASIQKLSFEFAILGCRGERTNATWLYPMLLRTMMLTSANVVQLMIVLNMSSHDSIQSFSRSLDCIHLLALCDLEIVIGQIRGPSGLEPLLDLATFLARHHTLERLEVSSSVHN